MFFPRLSLLLLAIVLLSGCAAHLQVMPSDGSRPAPAATAVPQEHAVALVGIDFDPPMHQSGLSAAALNDGITLMVAVDNRGISREHNVQVRAVLIDPAAAAGYDVLLDQTHVLPALEAGEVRLARFARVGALPYRARYQLRVFVEPVPGEIDGQDNYRSYDILVATE